ncbi:hypothetical protein HAX54_010839 [Datura stramonium]|uniref:Uncharacterized protein n=1 Tax=Datura stramonium TaxID=4076 RepID=A0ABS8THS3_DATST|nr:hypothetical protein [Datura stramonium]
MDLNSKSPAKFRIYRRRSLPTCRRTRGCHCTLPVAFLHHFRILIVDLLTHRLPTTAVAGLVILNAHSLSRSVNRGIYSDRTLKCLFLRKLHLWPRFQVYVSQDLEKDPPGFNGSQAARSHLAYLRKKTKQLVSDLKTLRKLLDYLVRYDAVTYLKYLDSLRASESFRSVWIFAESSYKIFEKLNDNKKDEDQSTSAESRVVLEEVLEEPPKWKVLLDVLVEIQEERDEQASSGEEKDPYG